MGRRRRIKPERLAEKLLHIRNALGLSQPELLRRLGFEGVLDYRRISEFELEDGEPPLPVLLKYARIAGVYIEDIVDDELDLPAKLPGNARHKGIKRKSAPRKR
ncbi:MAG TPA: helix-turn-helix transcriptional regulator [Pyrinomonadaceae bacterium]|jgi:transcriptional regulator with XRE-family HTH domain|nr:helix-turn-helix transcriptional regulator [Pyrinomonadaceae bacterium]